MTAPNSTKPEQNRGLLIATGAVFMFALTVGVGVTVLAFGLVDGGPGVASAQSVDDLGQQVYEANCAACHGATGGGGVGPALNNGVLVQKYPDPADHRTIVADGRAAMPSFAGVLSSEQINAVVEYERSGL